MSDFINETKLASDVMNAVDNNLKGEARRMFVDSYKLAQDPIVKFIKELTEILNKRFSN
jgi:hypothetical protein